MKYGLCMGGNEASFETLLRARAQAVMQKPRFNVNNKPVFFYVEIGVGGGETFTTAMDILASIEGIKPLGLGIDIPGGWSFDTQLAAKLKAGPHQDRAYIALRSDVDIFELENADEKGENLADVFSDYANTHDFGWHADFVFIDGCHGAPCAKKDLLWSIPWLDDGAVVVFHDASPRCQGHHMQPHCGTGIDVRKALVDMGLFKSQYPFKFLTETDADHGIAAFQFIVDSKNTKSLF